MKAKTALDEMKKGAFVRTASGFRHFIKKGGEFPPEKNRYHLYVSYACPWAHRCLITLFAKGLQDSISYSVVHPTWQRTRPDDEKDQHCGWAFRSPGDAPLSSPLGKGSFPCNDCIPDTINGAKTMRELYEMSKEKPTIPKFSVPVLWDKKEKTIVNNESSEIVEMFNSEFGELGNDLDLCPSDLKERADEVNSWIYEYINNGVYRCGFATSQDSYEEAFELLYTHLDKAEGILSKSRFLLGDRMTMSDIRLFCTLIRFDEVYAVYFKTNKTLIREYPNLYNFTKEIFQLPYVKPTVNMSHIKTHYFTSHPSVNPTAIIAKGLGKDWAVPLSTPVVGRPGKL